MRLLIKDIDDFFVTPADLSDIAFEGSPEAVCVSTRDKEINVTSTKSASMDRPSGTFDGDSWFDLKKALHNPGACDLRIEWDSGIAFLHVVKYHYCTINGVLDNGDEQRTSPRKLGRTEKDAFYARAIAETVVDDICGRTFRATYKSEPINVSGTELFQLAWPANTMLTCGLQLVGDGHARILSSCSRKVSLAEYISGTDAGVPADVRSAVTKLAASYLSVSNIPERATGESTDAGIIRYTLATEGTTGIPVVDAVLQRHARQRVVIA